jgi:hypothetical protein
VTSNRGANPGTLDSHRLDQNAIVAGRSRTGGFDAGERDVDVWSFGLTKDQAAREARIVIAAIDRWKKHFKSCGVSARDIESLAEQIDRPFLATQRREF